ncbi:MAG: hypothetical protein RR058_00080 [Oscillospiraceae bacterium]
MKTIFKVFWAFIGIVAAFFIADNSYKFVKDNRRRYITITIPESPKK